MSRPTSTAETATGTTRQPVIQVDDVYKSYGDTQALKGVSFDVYAGEMFALLGPNGAGKTTLLSIIEMLLEADSGQVTVLGQPVTANASRIKQEIGVQLQATSLLSNLTALEQMKMFARLYHRDMSDAEARDLLELVGIADKADEQPDNLSGGQKQRFVLALTLVNDPQIIFLDEPTAGLDPRARQRIWEIFGAMQSDGRTIVLTTHYIEEAEAVSDRTGIIHEGKLLALDTPENLIREYGDNAILYVDCDYSADELRVLPGVQKVEIDSDTHCLHTTNTAETMSALMHLAEEQGKPIRDFHTERARLENVFLDLTGKDIRKER